MIYFDHNATSPIRPVVADALAEAARRLPGNPSSPHREGLKARQALNEARHRVARALGFDREEIFFTSGATESNNLAIIGTLLSSPHNHPHAITTAVEHPSVLRPLICCILPQVTTTVVAVDSRGLVSPDDVVAQVRPETALVAIQLANNEIGTIQPVAALARMLRESSWPGARPVIVCDAVQAIGRIPVDLQALGADIVTISSHKMGGPRGVGIICKHHACSIRPVLMGGRQEGGCRPGTENVPAVIGAALALEQALAEQPFLEHHTLALRSRLLTGFRERLGDVVIHTPLRHSLPNTLSVAFPHVDARSLVAYLDINDIAVSTGSACASGSREPSHVIRAIGRELLTRATVRLSFGKANQAKEIDRLLTVLASAPGLRG